MGRVVAVNRTAVVIGIIRIGRGVIAVVIDINRRGRRVFPPPIAAPPPAPVAPPRVVPPPIAAIILGPEEPRTAIPAIPTIAVTIVIVAVVVPIPIMPIVMIGSSVDGCVRGY